MSDRRAISRHHVVAAPTFKAGRPSAPTPREPEVEPAVVAPGALHGTGVEEPQTMEPAHSGSSRSPEPVAESREPAIDPPAEPTPWRDPDYNE